MEENKKILTAPFTDDKIKSLKAGDMVFISGTIYTASYTVPTDSRVG